MESPIGWYVARWGDDPYSRGAWSCLAPGGTDAHRRLLGTPIDDRLMFVGDSTSLTAPSMVHGAYLEGLRAAEWANSADSVIIIGAGMAGLSAAHALTRAGVTTTVLEARPRIGGRIHSVGLGPAVIDAGAAWLQQRDTNPLVEVATRLRLKMVPTDFGGALAAGPRGMITQSSAPIDWLREHFERLGKPDLSLAELIADYRPTLSNEDQQLLDLAVIGEIDYDNGIDHDQLAAGGALYEPGVGNGDMWLPRGYRQMLASFTHDADIRVNTPVRRIVTDRFGVLVEGFTANKCICTVPIWLVPDMYIEPALPEAYMRAIGVLRPALVEKVVVQYTRRWWPPNVQGFLRWYDEPTTWGEWLDLTDHVGVPTVTALIAGDAVRRNHHGKTDEQIVHTVTEVIDRFTRCSRSGGAGAT